MKHQMNWGAVLISFFLVAAPSTGMSDIHNDGVSFGTTERREGLGIELDSPFTLGTQNLGQGGGQLIQNQDFEFTPQIVEPYSGQRYAPLDSTIAPSYQFGEIGQPSTNNSTVQVESADSASFNALETARQELEQGQTDTAIISFERARKTGTAQVRYSANVNLATIHEGLQTPESLDRAWGYWNDAAADDARALDHIIRFSESYEGFDKLDSKGLAEQLAQSDSELAPFAEYQLLLALPPDQWRNQIETWLNGNATENALAGQALQLLGDPLEAYRAFERALDLLGSPTTESAEIFAGQALTVLQNPNLFSEEETARAFERLGEAEAAGSGTAMALNATRLEDPSQQFDKLLTAQTAGADERAIEMLENEIGDCKMENEDFTNCASVDIAFITNRNRDEEGFGAKIAQNLSVGFARVVVPGISVQNNDESGRLKWLQNLFAGDAPDVGMPSYRSKTDDVDAFLDEIEARADQQFEGKIVLFIHGYNNTMDVVAQRMALLLAFSKADGLPLVYSWPSAGKLQFAWDGWQPRRAYRLDQDRSAASCVHARNLVEALITRFGGENVTILAHSMGANLVDSALKGCVEDGDLLAGTQLKALIYAAPDISHPKFEMQSDWAAGLSDAFNIYMSRQDVALLFSTDFNDDRRLGQGGGGRFVDDRFTIIDASPIEERASVNHAYVFEVKEAQFDLRTLLAGETDPSARICLFADRDDPFFYLVPFGRYNCLTH